MATAERITDSCTFHGEGPYWDPRNRTLLLVDMLAGDVLVMDASGTLNRHSVHPRIAAAIRGRKSGGYVIGVEHGFAFADQDFALITPGPEAFRNAGVRMNDGGCDPQGRFFCGSMDYESEQGAGTLYRLDTDLGVEIVLSDVTISNGLQWNAAGDTAFYVDTPTQRIDAFSFNAADGTFGERRTFASIDPELGAPDGLAIDAEDGLWVALHSGSAVVRFDAGGALSERIELPVTQVTACAFGGPEFETLYITTSRENLAPDAQPQAGSLFALDVGIRGASLPLFAG